MKHLASRIALLALALAFAPGAAHPQTITISVPVHPRYINDIGLPLMLFQQAPTSTANQVDWLDKNGVTNCWVDSDGLIHCLPGSGFGESIQRNGVFVGTQQTINFIEGANITIGASNDTMNNRVDVTISASGGGGGSESMQVDGVAISTQPIFNFITGTGVTLLGADDPGNTRANLTISVAPGNPADTLNTMSNRWASIVYDCHTSTAGPIEKAIAVFDEWDDSAITSRTCPNGTYLFPFVTHTTGAGASSLHDISTFGTSWALDGSPQLSARVSISDRAAGARRWIGWTDTTNLGMESTDSPTNANVIAFWSCPFLTIVGCNPNGGTHIWAVTENGVTANIHRHDTGIAYVPDQIYLFQIFYNGSTRTATFKIDGVTVATMNTDMPAAGTNVRFITSLTNTSGGQTYSMRTYGAFLYLAIP